MLLEQAGQMRPYYVVHLIGIAQRITLKIVVDQMYVRLDCLRVGEYFL